MHCELDYPEEKPKKKQFEFLNPRSREARKC